MLSTVQRAGACAEEPAVMPTDGKDHADHEEEIIKKEDHAISVMPDSLRRLTIEERHTIERRIVRKIDFIIL